MSSRRDSAAVAAEDDHFTSIQKPQENSDDDDDEEGPVVVKHALVECCAAGLYNDVRNLLDARADMEQPDDDGFTPLLVASQEGRRDVAALLLDRQVGMN